MGVVLGLCISHGHVAGARHVARYDVGAGVMNRHYSVSDKY